MKLSARARKQHDRTRRVPPAPAGSAMACREPRPADRPTAGQLKKQCATEYTSLRDQALGLLVAAQLLWVADSPFFRISLFNPVRKLHTLSFEETSNTVRGLGAV